MNGETEHDRLIAAAAVVTGWLVLVALFAIVAAAVALGGTPR